MTDKLDLDVLEKGIDYGEYSGDTVKLLIARVRKLEIVREAATLVLMENDTSKINRAKYLAHALAALK